MRSRSQRKTRVIMLAMMIFVLMGISSGGCFGVSKAYAAGAPIDGGVYKDATAPLITEPITDVNTYDGSVGKPMFFRFIPNSSEIYTIKSIGAVDTEGELYDSSGVSLNISDDEIGMNFCINMNLTAGITYYLRVTNYSGLNPDPTQLSITGDSGGTIQTPDVTSPNVTWVGAVSDGTYKEGSNLDLTVNFSEAVTVDTSGGTPSIAVIIGSTTVYADYISGSGTTALVFRYTVVAGVQDSDGITVGAMSLNGGTMRDGVGNDAVLTLNNIASTTGVKVDGVAPAVSSVSVPSNGTYKLGENLDFTVNFSEAVTVNTGGGTPRLTITVGGTAVYASYISGSGTSALVFRYTVAAGEQDSDGIAVGTMSLNGGTMKDTVGYDTVLTLNSVASTTGVLVNGVAPTVISVDVPSNNTYKVGNDLDFTVHFSEEVTVIGTPRLAITVGSTTVYADYASGSGASDLVFQYTVTAGVQDSDGIAVGSMSLNGGTMKDTAGNDAVLTLNSLAPTSGVKVDGVVPVITSVQVPDSGLYKEGDILEFTVNYAEGVIVTGTTSVLKINVGGVIRDVPFTSSSGSLITYRYIVQTGDNGGITIATNLELGTTTIVDNAGNNALISLNGVESTAGITIDTTAPGAVADINLSDHDINTGIDGRDFTVSFTDLAEESDVVMYKIYLYKDSEAPVNVAAMNILSAGSKVAVKTIAKTASNDGVAASLGSSVTTDSKGQTLNGGDYRIIIRAVDSAGNDSFAIAGTGASIIKDVDNSSSTGNTTPASNSTPKTEGKIEKDQKRNENAPEVSLNDNSEELKSKILSASEQELVEKGKDAKVILKIENISASVSAEDKKQIEEKLAAEQKNETDIALLYIDISLFKQIGDGEETKINKTSGKISISIEVPENMWNTKDGIDRTYHVIRVHDGVAELLTGTFDPISHLFTFETDRFSTYALTYQDVNTVKDQSKGSITDNDTVYNDFYHLHLTALATKTTQKLGYKKVSGADGYLIYGAQCGKQMKKLADVAGAVISYTVNNLKPATYYKYQVKAYKVINGKKVILATSKIIHTVTTSKIYANPTKITSDVAILNLSKGETKSVICQVVLPRGRKMKEHTAVIRYETTNSKVATISKGIIKAKSIGTCSIYAYTQNGKYVIIKVTVK